MIQMCDVVFVLFVSLLVCLYLYEIFFYFTCELGDCISSHPVLKPLHRSSAQFQICFLIITDLSLCSDAVIWIAE